LGRESGLPDGEADRWRSASSSPQENSSEAVEQTAK
jgi:hypothetical protein